MKNTRTTSRGLRRAPRIGDDRATQVDDIRTHGDRIDAPTPDQDPRAIG